MSTGIGPPQAPSNRGTLIQGISSDAELALVQGDWQAVDEIVDEILEIDPEIPRALELKELRARIIEDQLRDLVGGAGQALAQQDWQSVDGFVQKIREIDPHNSSADSFKTATDQNLKRIENLIKDAKQAMSRLKWQTVLEKAQDILGLDPADSNGLALRAAAYRGLGGQDQPTNWLSTAQRFLPIIPVVGIFAGLLVFLGRLYLESYYSYFGIPPAALHLEVQDYTFGSFPLVLFVLMLSAGVIVYWRAMPTGWLGNSFRRLFDFWWDHFTEAFHWHQRKSIKPVPDSIPEQRFQAIIKKIVGVSLVERNLSAAYKKIGSIPRFGGSIQTAIQKTKAFKN